MAIKLNSELDAYFNTGDQPSESNFQDLIDSILPAPVALTDAATITLTKAANQGRVNLVPNIGQASAIIIPRPAAAGEWYKFVSIFTAEEGDNLTIKTDTDGANTVYFQGGLFHGETDGNSQQVFSDGNSNEEIILEDPGMFEINVLSASDTVWYLWGWQVGADDITIQD